MRLPIRERSRAVFIGTSHFTGVLHDLPAVANNLTDLVDVLSDSDIGGFDRAHCTVLLDQRERKKILDLLELGAQQATDVLLVYLATHALPKTPSSAELQLCLPHTDVTASRWWHDSIDFRDVREIVRNSTAPCKVVIVDTCHAGLVLPEGMGPAEDGFDIGGAYTLVAVDPNSAAVAKPGERNTVFTGALLELLDKGVEGHGELLSLSQLFPLLRRRLLADNRPEPHHNLTQTIDGLALVRNRANDARNAIPDHVLLKLNSFVNTVRFDGLREMEALHFRGSRALRDQIRFHATRLVNDDSQMVSAEARRLLDLDKHASPSPQPEAAHVRKATGWGDAWWLTVGVAVLVLGTLFLWSAGSTLWQSALATLPGAVLAYVVAVGVSRWTR